VLVIAETLKPEERAWLRQAPPATMVVLNKADLTGADAGGPLASADRRAAALASGVGLPVVPMIAHLAAVDLDGSEIAALRALVTTPADMTSTDAFVGCQHPLAQELRTRLLARLDRFGLAHAVLAVADGAGSPAITAHLRGLSRIEAVLDALSGVTAPVRYRRIRAALTELRALAAQSGDDALDALLCDDAIVIAVMAAAVDVVAACGLAVDRGEDPSAHVRRAVQWRRYARGPVDVLHLHCATDISRGSLRLLGRAR
jgi:hypothetical protein